MNAHVGDGLAAGTVPSGSTVLALLTIAAFVMAVWEATTSVLRARRHRRLTVHAQQIVVTPPPQVEPHGVLGWWANLSGLLTPGRWRRTWYGRVHIALEYRWTGRHLQILVWVPGCVPAGPVAAAVRAAWPGASTTIADATDPLPQATRPAAPGTDDGTSNPGLGLVRVQGGALLPVRPAWFPLATDHDADPRRGLIGAATSLKSGEQACVQILARPATPRQIARARSGAAALKSGRGTSSGIPERAMSLLVGTVTELLTPKRSSGRSTSPTRAAVDPVRDLDARAGLIKLVGPQWEIAVRYGVAHTANRIASSPGGASPRHDEPGRDEGRGPRHREPDAIARRLTTLAHGISSSFAVYAAGNRLRPVRVAHPDHVLASRALRRGFLVSAPELAALAGLPTDLAVAGLDRARAKTVPAPIAVPSGGRGTKVLGRAAAGGHAVALPVVDARQHVHVLGSTGAGKSTFLAHLILGDIRARRAVVLIDPKGDLAKDVLERLTPADRERLILIDPDQPEASATFNPLQRRAGADDDLTVDNIVAIFAAIFQRHWGPRIDDTLRVACLTVMRHPNPTLITVPPLLNDKQFRAPFTVDLDDPEGLKGYWEWFEATPPALRAQVIGPVLARLRSFLLRDFVRATIGPPKSSFDMARLLDTGGILIARLPKGQLGEDTARLLGSLVFASVWQAATARARQPEPRRRDATVVIDEAHNILNLAGSVSDMLAEARGYRLSLVLAHQHLAQLPRDTQLALSANARNKIYFNCSPEDAHQLARHTLPELDEHDLSHLDAYTAATRLVIGNRETAAFTLATNPLPATEEQRGGINRTIIDGAQHPVHGEPCREGEPCPPAA
jgi:hypothetical protein